jgi:conjugal transfer pilus assembly protein TraB
MSTERIYLRSNSISCINADGRVTETGLNSTIVSTQDAMAGIRGQLVSRSSKLIGNSLLAGTLSGLSQGLTPKPLNSFTDQGDENQVFQYSSLSDVANFGAMSGASTALEKIADYYIELAEKAQPVISVRAGAEVDLMLTTGLKLKSGD